MNAQPIPTIPVQDLRIGQRFILPGNVGIYSAVALRPQGATVIVTYSEQLPEFRRRSVLHLPEGAPVIPVNA